MKFFTIQSHKMQQYTIYIHYILHRSYRNTSEFIQAINSQSSSNILHFIKAHKYMYTDCNGETRLFEKLFWYAITIVIERKPWRWNSNKNTIHSFKGAKRFRELWKVSHLLYSNNFYYIYYFVLFILLN